MQSPTTAIGKSERETQNRVIALFRDELGYTFLGDWHERVGNSNVEEALLKAWLNKQGHSEAEIGTALFYLKREVACDGRDLYHANEAVYQRLRYGVPVKVEAGKVTETIRLIDWDTPENNDFAIAEEVTLAGNLKRRPDLVLYVNGIALGVIELKSSRVGTGEGIRQLISNQTKEFHEWFFTTVQLVFAGSDTNGLHYGTTGTPEKYFLRWKEDETDDAGYKLDKYLRKMCRKDRLLELIHDFILFDGGVKKVPRVHQYFGIKEAQAFMKRREGGIIWHTQGSGKSIVMVLLAKWLLENNPEARVAVITDRDDLDKQISSVFTATGEQIHRASSGRDLVTQLGKAKPRLLCSLVHKFGRKDVDDFEAYVKELEDAPTKTVGEVFVFVDECHRTQSGKLHRVMKAMLPNAVFVGFTGTPLLKEDKKQTVEVFGKYIHTYKFSEAVEDEVVLDLIYEARNIDQSMTSQRKVDEWFEAKTRGLNDWQTDELRKVWATKKKLLSSKSRMERVVGDIIHDFSVRRRLSSERGNAILVAGSIHEACKYFTLFRQTGLKNKCAVVTSYDPDAKDNSKENTGEDTKTDKQFVYDTYEALLKNVEPASGKSKTETYEDEAKRKFTKEPATMKILIVVDKLLTGFDAPPCSFLYIDKSMQDHGLFQAICRTNRLDGEDKDFGIIVDYKDLFKNVENAIAVYSTDKLDIPEGGGDPNVLLKDRLETGRERLEGTLETLEELCEAVEPPKGELDHIRYFCGNTEVPTDLKDREPQRVLLYKGTASLVRAYADLADELERAGYSPAQAGHIKSRVDHFVKLRETIRQTSVETLDLKAYEADMRHLIDTYIRAEEPEKISDFDDLPLLDLIVKTGIADAIAKKLGESKGRERTVAETIENNVRSKIIKEHLNDPAFYEKMSELLDEIIKARKKDALDYERYLAKVAELVKRLDKGHAEEIPEPLKKSAAVRAIFNNLDVATTGMVAEGEPDRVTLAVKIDETVRRVKPNGFRGNVAKENVIKEALYPILNDDIEEVNRIFAIIEKQSEY